MTRETKIGLLVGLAFIIVIGILLSDHMTSTTDPPKAPLSTAGPNVRESVATPTSAQHAAAVAAAAPAAVVAPAQPVLTQQELLPQAVPPQQQAQRQPVQTPPVQTIQVGPGPAQAQPPITIQQTAQGPIVTQPQPPAATTAAQRRGASHPIQGLASQHGEEIVVLDPSGASQTSGPVNPPVPMAPLREYKAQTGDSLSRLASRFLGGNTKANRDAIIRANASLQQNPDRIIEGRTYLIPVATVAPTAPAAATTPVVVAPIQPVPAEAPAPAVQPDAASGAFTWYTVKENDNLWRIAADQLGTGTAANQIKDFNADVLKGNDNLQVGMRLRIPPKPVASAN